MWIGIEGVGEVPALVWVMEGAGDAMWLMRWEAVRGGWWGRERGKSPGRSRGGAGGTQSEYGRGYAVGCGVVRSAIGRGQDAVEGAQQGCGRGD